MLAATSTSVNNVEPGALGFLVVAGIGVALVFLLRSMNKQFKKIGPRPEDPSDAAVDESQPDPAFDASADASAAAKRG